MPRPGRLYRALTGCLRPFIMKGKAPGQKPGCGEDGAQETPRRLSQGFIHREDGAFLACQRPAHKARGPCWAISRAGKPGGGPGALAQALARAAAGGAWQSTGQPGAALWGYGLRVSGHVTVRPDLPARLSGGADTPGSGARRAALAAPGGGVPCGLLPGGPAVFAGFAAGASRSAGAIARLRLRRSKWGLLFCCKCSKAIAALACCRIGWQRGDANGLEVSPAACCLPRRLLVFCNGANGSCCFRCRWRAILCWPRSS